LHYDKLNQADPFVRTTLDGLDDIIQYSTVKKKFEPGGKGGRVLVDVTYDLFLTHGFASEQKVINKHDIGLQVRAEARRADLFED